MNDIIKFPTIRASNIGYLSFFQDNEIGFDIKRIYYIYGVPKGY